jgi:rhodanese-related sulfurtransferase
MKQAFFQALVLTLLAGVLAAAAFQFHPRAPALYLIQEPTRADEVTLAQIQERWDGKVIWLDARPKDQFEIEHIPEAKLLNEQGFDEQLLTILDTLQTATQPVIIYCGGQKCEASRHVREKLTALVPLDHCYILKGGWPAWKEAQGMPAKAGL